MSSLSERKFQRTISYGPTLRAVKTIPELQEWIWDELRALKTALESDTLQAGNSRHDVDNETGLLVWVRQNVSGTMTLKLERVTLGANNSGGAGYRLLRVPNDS